MCASDQSYLRIPVRDKFYAVTNNRRLPTFWRAYFIPHRAYAVGVTRGGGNATDTVAARRGEHRTLAPFRAGFSGVEEQTCLAV